MAPKKPKKKIIKKKRALKKQQKSRIVIKSEIGQNRTKLSIKKLKAIELLSCINKPYVSMGQVALKCGVSRSTLYEWFDDEEFTKKIIEKSQKNAALFGAKIRASHLRVAMDGNTHAIKLYYEYIEEKQQKLKIEDTTKNKSKVLIYIPHNGRDNKDISPANGLSK